MDINRLKNISLQNLIAIGYLILISLVHFHLDNFYSAFNIKISSYLNPIEYLFPLLPFFSNITVFIVIILIFPITSVILEAMHSEQEKVKQSNEEPTQNTISQKKNKILKKTAKILDVIVSISLSLSVFSYFVLHYSFDGKWIEYLIIFNVGLISFSLLFALSNERNFFQKRRIPIRELSLAIFFIVMAFWASHHENSRNITKIKQGENRISFVFKSKSKSVYSNDTLRYLGQSREFVFFYDIKNEESHIFNKETGNQIIISE
ncbi:MAG: hypothetical protein K9H84_07395 [Bacteroidales bacterium]|nr:hypothetical protein [Bacteroidales bacterium]